MNMTDQASTPMQVALRQLREQQDHLGDQALLELTFDMLKAAEASNRELLKALEEFGGETASGWHAVQCAGGHGGDYEPPPTKRCSKARAAIEKAEATGPDRREQ